MTVDNEINFGQWNDETQLIVKKNTFREFNQGFMVFPGVYLNPMAAFLWEESMAFGSITKGLLKQHLVKRIKNRFLNLPSDSILENDAGQFIDNCITSGIFERIGPSGLSGIKPLTVETKWIPKVELVLTHHCNFRCRHCFIDAKREIENELSLVQWEVILRKLLNMGLIHLILSGGEPVSYKHIVNLLKIIDSLPNLFIDVLTNGSLVGRTDVLRLLEKFKDRLKVQISLNSVEDAGYKEFTGQIRHSLNKTLKNIEILSAAGIRPQIITQVNAENIRSLLDGSFLAVLEKMGIEIWVIQPYWRSIGRALTPRNLMLLDAKRSHSFVREMETTVQNTPINHSVKIIMESVPSLTYGTSFFSEEYSYSACKGYSNSMAIDANGDIFICSEFISFRKNTIGNALDLTEEEIIRSLHDLKGRMRKEVLSVTGICATCSMNGTCKGGCRADAFGNRKQDSSSPQICEQLFREKLFPREWLSDAEVVC